MQDYYICDAGLSRDKTGVTPVSYRLIQVEFRQYYVEIIQVNPRIIYLFLGN